MNGRGTVVVTIEKENSRMHTIGGNPSGGTGWSGQNIDFSWLIESVGRGQVMGRSFPTGKGGRLKVGRERVWKNGKNFHTR